ncbi:MAG: glycosyltransferase family 61 protein [Clostridia bacterium]|nr:glycosyltransferase family 61 protein [Clostridia bacterium]
MKVNYDYVKKSMLKGTKERCEANYLSKLSLSITEINEATLLPGKMSEGGGIFDKDRYYDHSHLQNAYAWAKAYPFNESELIYDDREVLYLGMFHDTWGHCITDCISQLWPLFSENVPEYIRNAQWVYTTQHPAPLPANFFRLLQILGIDIEKLEYISKPTKFKKIYLPDKSFYVDADTKHRMYTLEYKDIIDRILSKIDADERYPKIYFTRTAFSGNRDFGEEAIEKVFRDMGYHIVSPEKFSFEEQVAMLKGCKSFTATEGSCSHNALFMQPGNELITIRKIDHFYAYQYPINAMKELNAICIDANLSHLPNNRKRPWLGPFFVYVNKRMAAFAGVQPHFPVKTYCRYAYPQLKKMVKRRLKRILHTK